MATNTKQTKKKKTQKTTTKSNTRKSKKNTKKATGSNVAYYEIKLILLVAFTILSIFSLHTELVGVVGAFIKNIYFGLFSYAGYSLPYIIAVAMFFKLNNRLMPYRIKTITGIITLFISIVLVVNILNLPYLSDNYITPGISILKFTSIEQLYKDGVNLSGSGLIGTLTGRLLMGLIGKVGLYISVLTLWIISFILITNIHLSVWLKHKYKQLKDKSKENKKIKATAKEEYLKGAEKLEKERLKEQERIRKAHEKAVQERSQDKLDKALDKVDKKLKAEEKANQRILEEYDAMFAQSPTKSLVDKLLKKTTVPSAEELKIKQQMIQEQKHLDEENALAFDQYSTKGYVFDESFHSDEIVKSSPDIFDNHQDDSRSEEEKSIQITGFGTLIDESIAKAYKDEEIEKQLAAEQANIMAFESIDEKAGLSFDEAFKASEEALPDKVVYEDDIFDNRTPMTEEEKRNIDKFDAITGNKPQHEESQIPDERIVQHMSQSVQLEFDNYKIPSVNILNENNTLNSDNKAELYEKANLLEEILSNFKIDAEVIQISKGPAITRYEIELKPGTKMSKITNLTDDIALNLATQQVRIAAVPGKAAVGIEVPNDKTSLVTLREVLDSKEFSTAKSHLAVGLGKNIAGKPIVADLAKMPHMLIAGATGSGKSVCVNTIITSILLNSKPDEVKFLMIDPKVVELNNYNGIPHLILPVVTDPKKASVALNWAVQEMTRRYNEFAENGVRDIKGYNKRYGDDKEKFMPQIVVIIDELADLMMVAPNQVEDAICRLAQMARAAGIHLIVATQRPSVDVITGVIKANIPSRIAFSVSSAIDSRTIIDMSGAEKLLGKGDMLYYPVGSSKPQRVQGAFISDEEVEVLVDAVKNQFQVFSYDESLLTNVSSSISTESTDEADEYLPDAIKLVVEMEQASISMLQRKFKIGYNRAARIVDEMEERGIVGPSQGSKPRNVLISKGEL